MIDNIEINRKSWRNLLRYLYVIIDVGLVVILPTMLLHRFVSMYIPLDYIPYHWTILSYSPVVLFILVCCLFGLVLLTQPGKPTLHWLRHTTIILLIAGGFISWSAYRWLSYFPDPFHMDRETFNSDSHVRIAKLIGGYFDNRYNPCRAIDKGDLVRLKELIQPPWEINSKLPSKGATLLHYAARYGTLASVKYLVEHGANVNTQNRNGNSPLSYAVIHGDADIVHYLLENGANIQDSDVNHRPILQFAIRRQLPNVPLPREGNTEVIRLLVSHGAGVNERDRNGNTVLMLAAAAGYPAVVSCLVELGADTTAMDSEGLSIIHRVANGRDFTDTRTDSRLETLRYLVEHAGCSLDSVSADGKTILSLARKNGHHDIVQYYWNARNPPFPRASAVQ